MFTNNKRQAERTGKYGTPRPQHLQQLITQFQNSTISNESKEKIVANLANFSYDPYNYAILRDLNVLELFIDCLTEPNERLIEFAVGGICNAVADPQNAQIVCDCGGVAALIDCLSSPVRNTVKYAIAGLYYLVDLVDLKEKENVVDLISKYSQVDGFANLAQALLDKISKT
ncbi:armadillo repeat-containing protein 7-like isoform X1 [Chenopodium quinoa]|uniref:armadillo repeat-containing protein 7-like isoform X1 n=1 Tax=Chenopodium quinoa TaxID=63459 RepID=UPI000B786185|nr:armadillo repeat-containing protein 7-like isoform X1 [Chenopodium quinoa]